MKKLPYSNSTLLFILLFVATACDGLFIPDPIDPRVPKYTADGNNVAGAYINGDIWESVVTYGFPKGSSNVPHLNLWAEADSLSLTFSGSTSAKNTSIQFHLQGLKIAKFEDLYRLEDRKITLDGNNNTGFYIEDYYESRYENRGVGQIYFKEVHFDSSYTRIILSGTFGFSVNNTEGKTIQVSSGRFDYWISKDSNFDLRSE